MSNNYEVIKAALAAWMAEKFNIRYDRLWVTFPDSFGSVDFFFGREAAEGGYKFAQTMGELYTSEDAAAAEAALTERHGVGTFDENEIAHELGIFRVDCWDVF